MNDFTRQLVAVGQRLSLFKPRLLEIQPTRSMLVVAPHPDDESFGCGGTLCLHTQQKARVDVAFLTQGEMGGSFSNPPTDFEKQRLAQKRRQEASDACKILGVNQYTFLNGRDSLLSEQPDIYKEVLKILENHRYDTLLCPWPADAHPDHRAASQACFRVLGEYSEKLDIWFYEVRSPLPANCFCDITAAIGLKIKALRAHVSQGTELCEHAWCLGRYRAVQLSSANYAEAFLQISSSDFLRLLGLVQ
ncbi:MAG: PIG-L family deacetylase [Deltaproteobacteria bacterium]|nr:PIG-L family deacetylase [Deltaproteobacteria bacterium]